MLYVYFFIVFVRVLWGYVFLKMFFFLNFFFSLFESEGEENFNEELVEFGGVVFYDEDLELLVIEEEVVEYEVRMV